ncbi:MAG TPA: amidase [Candidatus Avidesulfovibrio excrementigallinarum]|nr:amidase [Candidatus Avidesulfovibrio excrementigallinarum]
MNELIRLTAVEAVERLQKGDITPSDLLEASIERIEEVEPAINALPIRCFDHAREELKKLPDRAAENSQRPGWLGGLPIAVKDLAHVAGVRTTMGGSRIFENFVATESNYSVQNLERHGAIAVAKSASPEFGFNATTFSTLFGDTLNPWDPDKTTGGSSGGSAAAVAAGEVWMATGSDLGSSIRQPASFCGIVGLRPSPGMVPRGPRVPLPFNLLPVEGPMARNVKDTALMFDAMRGAHYGDPLSFDSPVYSFLEEAKKPRNPQRVGFSVDLGITHVHSRIEKVARAAMASLERAGIAVEEAQPDLSLAKPVFHAIRGTGHIASMAPYFETHRDMLTPEIVWSVENARKQTPDEIATAERGRGQIVHKMTEFFKDHDLLICPATVTPTFPHTTHSLKELEGYTFDTYIDWIAITFSLTLTACPVLSVPCGKDEETGMPVGLQIVAKPRHEADLFAFAARFEEIWNLGVLTPVTPGR